MPCNVDEDYQATLVMYAVCVFKNAVSESQCWVSEIDLNKI